VSRRDEPEVFDYFISYKHRDAKSFAENLAGSLRAYEANIWLDQDEMLPGDSILRGIETGIQSSIDAIVILSQNYFTGWSEQERSSLYALMVSQKLRIIPVWFRLDRDEVESMAPMFAGMVGIQAQDDSESEALRVARAITAGYKISQRRSRLFELFFRAVRRHIEDPDIDVFLAVFDNDTERLEKAVAAGADVNITDTALWNRHNRILVKHADVFPAWRRLFLFLSKQRLIGSAAE